MIYIIKIRKDLSEMIEKDTMARIVMYRVLKLVNSNKSMNDVFDISKTYITENDNHVSLEERQKFGEILIGIFVENSHYIDLVPEVLKYFSAYNGTDTGKTNREKFNLICNDNLVNKEIVAKLEEIVKNVVSI